MDDFSNQHLRLCVFAFNGCHILAAYFFGVDVCHVSKVEKSSDLKIHSVVSIPSPYTTAQGSLKILIAKPFFTLS